MRTIKPQFFTDDRISEVSCRPRLLLLGLKSLADREGRLEDRPKQIKAFVFAYDDITLADIEGDLMELATCEHPMIVRYQAFNEAKLIQIVDWHADQMPHIREAPSTFPAPDEVRPRTAPVLEQQRPSTDLATLRTENGEGRMENLNSGTSVLACQALSDSGSRSQPKANRHLQKPTIQEIAVYCEERKIDIDAASFWHYYESNGWLVGKNPMKDWRSAVQTWKTKSFSKSLKPINEEEIPYLRIRTSQIEDSSGGEL